MSILMTGEVFVELSALPRFGSNYVEYIVLISPSYFVNNQGHYWGFIIHAHDLIIVATRGGMRLAWLSDGRIRSHLQAFNVALSSLLLAYLESYYFFR